VQDSKFSPWLVKVPSDKLLLRAGDLNQAPINNLEELWKTEPAAWLYELDRPDVIDKAELLSPILLRYEDGYHYQNILAPVGKVKTNVRQ